MNTEEFIEAARRAHGNRYDYGKSVFKTKRQKVTIICKVHGEFETSAGSHMKGMQCIKCAGKARLTKEDFTAKSITIHGNKFDYSKVEYLNNSTNVEIICHEHGSFWQKPYSHMQGVGCRACSGSEKKTTEEFVTQAIIAHGNKYDYSKAKYQGTDSKITIICPEHGEFQQIAYSHLQGRGCVQCGIEKCSSSKRHNKEQFIRKSVAKFGSNYDYDKADFVAMRHKVIVTCREHGDFLTLPKDHISKRSGCPKCARESTSSAGETELAVWIESLGVPTIRNCREALDGFEIDIYIPGKNIGIEYNGSYWHSDDVLPHPRIHETKANRAEQKGIRLITVWDFDWENRQEITKNHIKHAIGIGSTQRFDARKCSVQNIDSKTSGAFYDTYHAQGAAWRSITNIGLFYEGNIIACMSFSQGSGRRGKTGESEWELTRYATSGIVRGGASKLFTSFIRDKNPKCVWSFSDRQHFGGGLYQAIGFVEDGRAKADYKVLHQQTGRLWHKSAWQRRNIPKRLAELGVNEYFDPGTDNRTEREMQKIARVLRIMDSGKIRWKWTA